jgi:spore germination protein (amino acid permease)
MHLGLIFFMYPSDIIDSTDQSHWVPIFLGIIIHLIFLWIYMKGLSFFPKMDIIHIYIKAGKSIAFIFLLPVVIYLLVVIITTVRAHSEIINIVFLAETPQWAIMVLLLLIPTYIAVHGVEVIFRTGLLVACLFLPLILFTLFMSFQNIDWRYLFPLFDIDFSFITHRSYIKSYFAFAGGFLFIGFVQPYLSYNRKKILLAALALIPFFILSVYIPILTFGQATSTTLQFPFVLAVDTIYIHWLIFDRITTFFLLSLIIFIMLLISLVLWKTSRIISYFLASVKQAHLIYLLSIFTFMICLMIPDWDDIEQLFWFNTFFRFYILVVIPLSIYIFGWWTKGKAKDNYA